ncbi:hypothetical protein B0H14DRAFT_2554196 [Mycena olivaceomarginata]|nr:hypothetical protein B0H14DRAFT_2554196 [Mycena olivaceomarginata]
MTNDRQRNTFLGWKCAQPISFQGPDRWIRVALGILSVLSIMVWTFWKQQSQGRLVQKAEAKITIPLEIPYPSIIQPMSHAPLPLASPVLADVEPSAPTPILLDTAHRPSATSPQPALEDVQYLIRVPPGDPPMPVVALSASGPVATIAEALPPQSEYYGHVVLPNGQTLHRSSAANVFRIFRNRETGAPFTMSCHEFTLHITTPDDPQVIWDFELCYPEAGRLRQAMATLVPLAAPDAGFLVHAAKDPPPMLPLHQRLTLNQDAPFDRASAQEVMAEKRTMVAPEEILGNTGLPLAYLSELAPFTALILGPHGIRYETTMARDIHQRAQESLRLDGDELFPSGSDSNSMPDLVSMYSSSSDSDDGIQALEQGLCNLCLERQHTSALDCSLFGIERAVREVKRLSDIWEDKKDSSSQGDMQMEADDPLAPTMSEWLSRRPVSMAFQALVAAAREARLVFEEFTVEFDVPHEGTASAGTIALLERETEGTGEMSTGTNSDEGDGNGNVAVGIIRTVSPVQRAELPYPRLIRETRGYATARAQDAAAHKEEETREMYRQETMSSGNWSLAISDWVLNDLGILSLGHDIASDEDSDADSREELEAHAELPTATESEAPPRVAPRNPGATQLVHGLMRWIYKGKAHQQTHLHFEDEMGCGPANCALRALHGPLSTFVDYAAMAAEGISDLHCPSPPPYGLDNHPPIPDDTPDSDSSSASLDPSLPGRSLPLAVSAECSTVEDEAGSGIPDDFEAVDVQQSVGSKHKNPDGETGGLNQQGMRKKTSKFVGDSLRCMVLNREAVKATGLSDGTVVRFMAGVRLAILEAGRRIEDMVWHRYGITDVHESWPWKTGAAANFRHDGMFQHSIPTRFLHHPLLFDVEVAKLQTMWHILQRNGRIKLADALHELLSIKLRNEYVVSHILNAGYLDYNYPEYESSYKDLLDDPETLSNYRRTFSEYQMHQYDADSEDQDSESSGGFLYPGVGDEEAFYSPCDRHGRRFCRVCGSRRSDEARIQEHLRTYMAPDPNINALGLAL